MLECDAGAGPRKPAVVLKLGFEERTGVEKWENQFLSGVQEETPGG